MLEISKRIGKNMKRLLLLFLLCSSSFLHSCSTNNIATSEMDPASLIYTSVAASLTAQASSIPTETSTPSSTVTLTPTIEKLEIPTLAQVAIKTVSNALTCDNAAFIGDVTIPDGTILSPGETFTKTWRVQNSGSCDWSTTYALSFNSGESMNGSTVYFPYAVSSGNQMDISVELTTPSDLGTYVGYWKMQNANGIIFGQTLYVQITVAESTATSTLTPTTTVESTETPTPTMESATATIAPSETPEELAPEEDMAESSATE